MGCGVPCWFCTEGLWLVRLRFILISPCRWADPVGIKTWAVYWCGWDLSSFQADPRLFGAACNWL